MIYRPRRKQCSWRNLGIIRNIDVSCANVRRLYAIQKLRINSRYLWIV